MTIRWAVVPLTVLTMSMPAQDGAVERAARLERTGDLRGAAAILEQELRTAQDDATRSTIAFELDRLHRIRLDYDLDRAQVWEQVKRSVKDVTREEFERWITEGKFDIRRIDGEERFIGVSRSNLFWRYPEIAARRISPPDETKFERSVWETAEAITRAADSAHGPYVLPKRFRTTMTVTADPNAAPPGAVIRAWLPVPRVYPYQSDLRLTSSNAPVRLDDPSSPIRSAYLERTAVRDSATVFRVEYEYTRYGIRFDLDPARVEPYDPRDTVVARYTREEPHIVFTDTMRALANALGGQTNNPLEKARAFYNWISERIAYSYALEYSTIRNIGEYCLRKGYGDCGQEAFLYLTLCRVSGVPARWQSAWFTFPGGKTIHDWTEIYVRPWGWIPVDPYMGIFAMRYLRSLDDVQRRGVRDFYFGGMDQYRIAANSGHNEELRPPKRTMRSDNVDFQRGELEYDGGNIYFDRYRYRLDIREVPPGSTMGSTPGRAPDPSPLY